MKLKVKDETAITAMDSLLSALQALSHTQLADIGVNSHAQIDSHISGTINHGDLIGVTSSQHHSQPSIFPPIFIEPHGGFTFGVYNWQILHSDNSAYVACGFVIPISGNYKFGLIHYSSEASKTDAGHIYLGQNPGNALISYNNKLNGVAFDLVNTSLNYLYFTESTTIALTANYHLLGYWYKDTNAGTGNLNVSGVYLRLI